MPKGCVYAVLCTETKRMYVGRHNSGNRKRAHFNALRAGKHKSRLMQHDFDKYGEISFQFITLQEGEIKSNSGKDNIERYWMERLQTYNPHFGYNYLDPFFVNGIRDPEKKRKFIAEKYDFPVELL